MNGYNSPNMFSSNMQPMGVNMQFYNPMQPRMDRLQQIEQQNYYNSQSQQRFNSNVQSDIKPNTLIEVTGIEEAKKAFVEIGSTLHMKDMVLPRLYIKEKTLTGEEQFDVYSLTKLENDNIKNHNENNEQQINVNSQNFVHIDEFNKLNQNVQELNAKITMYETLLQGLNNNQVKEVSKTTSTSKKGGVNSESSK